jgi:hypothetical protein
MVQDFEENVGSSVAQSQQLISVERLEPTGFFDEAVGLKVLQGELGGFLEQAESAASLLWAA